jgi:single-strand DNA-binding protein
MGINKAILIGNLGKDPEVKHLDGGLAVARFSLATNEVYRNKQGNRVSSTEWHNIVVWRNLANIAEKYLHKGSSVYLEGKIKTRSYKDKNGNDRYITEIVGNNIQMLDSKRSGEDQDQENTERNNTNDDYTPDDDPVFDQSGASDETDDLPF